jgi:cell division protein FtsB
MAAKKKSLKRIVVVVAVATIGTIVLVAGINILDLYGPHRDLRRLEGELRAAKYAVDSLTVELSRLKNDTAYIERVAREKLGMARKDEKIYKFVGKKP